MSDRKLLSTKETNAREARLTVMIKSRRKLYFFLPLLTLLATLQSYRLISHLHAGSTETAVNVPLRVAEFLDKCRALGAQPGPSPDFYTRTHSDRFVSGTAPTLIIVGHDFPRA